VSAPRAYATLDAEMKAWLRSHATTHPYHGFRRALAALRFDERREVDKTKVHRLRREECQWPGGSIRWWPNRSTHPAR